MNNNHKIEIHERYKDYSPPHWVRSSASRLIDAVPTKYVIGLHSVILTNTDGLNHQRKREKTRSRKRKVALIECAGLYHQKWQRRPAMIELFVDKIVTQWPALVLKVPLFQDLLLADVLYHELGHHIHKTSAPEHRESEDVAENWGRRLERYYFRQRYKWLKPLRVILKPIVVFFQWITALIKRQTTRVA